MKEMVKRIIAHAGTGALISAQAFEKAAAELGYGKEEIAAAMKDFDGFPLDDDDLLDVVGGVCIENGYVNQTSNGGNFMNQTTGGNYINQTIGVMNVTIG
ncbi:MAG: hypothetical protein ABRQ26_14015 [Syntrophomonadaceae bacterium]